MALPQNMPGGESQFLANYLGKLQFRFLPVTARARPRHRHRRAVGRTGPRGDARGPTARARSSGPSAPLPRTLAPDPELLPRSRGQNGVASEFPNGPFGCGAENRCRSLPLIPQALLDSLDVGPRRLLRAAGGRRPAAPLPLRRAQRGGTAAAGPPPRPPSAGRAGGPAVTKGLAVSPGAAGAQRRPPPPSPPASRQWGRTKGPSLPKAFATKPKLGRSHAAEKPPRSVLPELSRPSRAMGPRAKDSPGSAVEQSRGRPAEGASALGCGTPRPRLGSAAAAPPPFLPPPSPRIVAARENLKAKGDTNPPAAGARGGPHLARQRNVPAAPALLPLLFFRRVEAIWFQV